MPKARKPTQRSTGYPRIPSPFSSEANGRQKTQQTSDGAQNTARDADALTRPGSGVRVPTLCMAPAARLPSKSGRGSEGGPGSSKITSSGAPDALVYGAQVRRTGVFTKNASIYDVKRSGRTKYETARVLFDQPASTVQHCQPFCRRCETYRIGSRRASHPRESVLVM